MGLYSGAARDLMMRDEAGANAPAEPTGEKADHGGAAPAVSHLDATTTQASIDQTSSERASARRSSAPWFPLVCYGARGMTGWLPVANGFSNLASGKPSASSRRVRRAYRSSRVARRFLSPYRLSALRSWRAISAQIIRRGVVGVPLRSATVLSDSWQDIDLETRQPLMEMTWSGAGRCSGAPPTGRA